MASYVSEPTLHITLGLPCMSRLMDGKVSKRASATAPGPVSMFHDGSSAEVVECSSLPESMGTPAEVRALQQVREDSKAGPALRSIYSFLPCTLKRHSTTCHHHHQCFSARCFGSLWQQV